LTGIAQGVECQWCHGHNAVGLASCERCGAPLNVRDRVTDSGWRESPRLRDLTEVRFGASSSLQVDGSVVPVVEVTLHPDDAVYFEHHAMLWKDDSVPMSVMSTPGGAKRLLGDLPFVLSVAHGPGRLAFSRDAGGSSIVLPIDPGMQVEVRGHAMLLASQALSYSFQKVPGLRTVLMAGTGMYLDRFEALAAPGVLVLHGFGSVFERTLGQGESIQLEPGGFLYKDATVTMEVVNVDMPMQGGSQNAAAQGLQSAKQLAGRGFRGLKAARELMSGGITGAAERLMGGDGGDLASAFSSNTRMSLMKLVGPGRVGMQSMYQHRTTD
jgi:uncharacterized protein (AIM24 family)